MNSSISATNSSMLIACFVAFMSGALSVVILVAVLLLYFISRITRRRTPPTGRPLSMDAEAHSPGKIFIEGDIWITSCSPVQLENVVKNWKLSKERKPKKDVEELGVTMKYAKLENRILYLTSLDGMTSSIRLEGSTVLAVSSTMSATRKWAKKYPVKLEHTDRTFPDSICLLYFKTGWEKESWCDALRAAARKEEIPEDSYSRIKCEFRDYLVQLRDNYPDIFKLGGSGGGKGPGKLIGSAKKSVSWRRLLKKRSKGADGYSKSSKSEAEDVKSEGSNRSNGDEHDGGKWESDGNNLSDPGPESSKKAEPSAFLRDAIMAKRFDGNAAALNMVVSRLFFDLHHSSSFNMNIQRRLQNTLARIPTLSYIGPITSSGIDLGKSPPVIHGFRALPIVDDVWGVELDITYLGGAAFTFETRLDLKESRSSDHKFETSLAGAATADIINKSIQTVEDDLESAGEISTADQNAGGSKGPKKRWSQWKTFLSSVADQVSQVPLVLSMRMVSLRGTLQLRIKAAPSDRIWYGFSTMPELELVPEPSFGEHKITTGPLLAYIAERIQILISETVVLPNCEDIYVPWMISDEEDWLQESCVPLPQVLTEPKSPEKSKQSCNDNSRPHIVELEACQELKEPLLEKHEEAGTSEQHDITVNNRNIDDSSRISETDSQRKKSKREKMLSLGKKFEEKTRNFAEKMRERFEKD